jgi:pimeloyl-ACP methyl ester carboxylesterase
MPSFYPTLPDALLEAGGVRLPEREENTQYEELILVGHSLGGVVIRRALIDSAEDWTQRLAQDAEAERPRILDGQVYLFSPATAGFRPAGWMGFLRSGPTWCLVEMQLRRSSAYSDLQLDSEVLRRTKQRTEAALASPKAADLDALRARILWANPDDVVVSDRYDTDFVDHFIDGPTHRSVCKPNARYEAPWRFVETGRP